MPAASKRSANSASPSSTGGLAGCPRSVDSRLRSGAGRADRRRPRAPRRTCRCAGVVKQRSSSAPRSASADLVGDREVLAGELGVGDDDVAHARARAPRRRPRRSRRGRGGRSRARARGGRRPRSPSCSAATARRRRRPPPPARPRRRARAAPAGSAPTAAPWRPAVGRDRARASLTASTVGSQTIRAPSRAAISTASGFSPPTAPFSVIVPMQRTPVDRVGHDPGALRGRRVVGLEREAGEPASRGRVGEVTSSMLRPTTSGSDVDVQVVRAADELAAGLSASRRTYEYPKRLTLIATLRYRRARRIEEEKESLVSEAAGKPRDNDPGSAPLRDAGAACSRSSPTACSSRRSRWSPSSGSCTRTSSPGAS